MNIKTHLRCSNTLKCAPNYVIADYRKQGLAGTKCGYVSQNVTADESKVTCKRCLSKMNNS
jgi:hypothetical protein